MTTTKAWQTIARKRAIESESTWPRNGDRLNATLQILLFVSLKTGNDNQKKMKAVFYFSCFVIYLFIYLMSIFRWLCVSHHFCQHFNISIRPQKYCIQYKYQPKCELSIIQMSKWINHVKYRVFKDLIQFDWDVSVNR